MTVYSLQRGLLLVGFIAALSTAAPAAPAMDSEDPATIRAAVEAALAQRIVDSKEAKIEVAVAAIDPRLQLPRCPAIDVALPPTTGAAMTAKVFCATVRAGRCMCRFGCMRGSTRWSPRPIWRPTDR